MAVTLIFVYIPVVKSVNIMSFSKLFNLFHRELLVAAIKQAAEITSIFAYFHRLCLFLVAVILLPENRYHKLVPVFWFNFSGTGLCRGH